MSACIGQPVSWLALERHALGELPAAQAQALEEHLACCAACRACRAQLDADTRDLGWLTGTGSSPSAAASGRPVRRSERRRSVAGWLALGGACAAALLALRLAPAPAAPAAQGVKGSEIALGLVRLDAHGRQLEPVRFAASDRFKVLLTCPPAQREVRVLIYQAAEVYEPVPPQALRCGNRVALQGAWSFTGSEPLTVCAVLGADRAGPLRSVETLQALGLQHACATLEPQ